jgi:hypothetical protein
MDPIAQLTNRLAVFPTFKQRILSHIIHKGIDEFQQASRVLSELV